MAEPNWQNGFVGANVHSDAQVYTDEAPAYNGLPNPRQVVCQSAKGYVNGMAHTHGIESFWALLKRGYHGTYHHFSVKHAGRYVSEFAGRHNRRFPDTEQQMRVAAHATSGKRSPYKELVA